MSTPNTSPKDSAEDREGVLLQCGCFFFLFAFVSRWRTHRESAVLPVVLVTKQKEVLSMRKQKWQDGPHGSPCVSSATITLQAINLPLNCIRSH